MSSSRSILKWFFAFLFSLILGFGLAVIIYFWNPNFATAILWRETNLSEAKVVDNFADACNHEIEPTSHHQPLKKFQLKNPFVIPWQFVTPPRVNSLKRAFLEYQGIIETDDATLGLVKITSDNETIIVQQGQNIEKYGLEIREITPQTLTYFKNGKEVVISLGGIKIDP